MAKNEEFRYADHVALPVPEGTKAGDPVRVGALNGVAQTNVATETDWAGGNKIGEASVWLNGSARLHVNAAVNVGDPVYYQDANTLTTEPVAGDAPFGVALATQAGAGTVAVKIISVSPRIPAVQEPAPETQAATRRAKA